MFYSASRLKQESAGRNIASLGGIILIPSHPFGFLGLRALLIGGATHTNVIVFGMANLSANPDLPHSSEHANHYTNDEVYYMLCRM